MWIAATMLEIRRSSGLQASPAVAGIRGVTHEWRISPAPSFTFTPSFPEKIPKQTKAGLTPCLVTKGNCASTQMSGHRALQQAHSSLGRAATRLVGDRHGDLGGHSLAGGGEGGLWVEPTVYPAASAGSGDSGQDSKIAFSRQGDPARAQSSCGIEGAWETYCGSHGATRPLLLTQRT